MALWALKQGAKILAKYGPGVYAAARDLSKDFVAATQRYLQCTDLFNNQSKRKPSRTSRKKSKPVKTDSRGRRPVPIDDSGGRTWRHRDAPLQAPSQVPGFVLVPPVPIPARPLTAPTQTAPVGEVPSLLFRIFVVAPTSVMRIILRDYEPAPSARLVSPFGFPMLEEIPGLQSRDMEASSSEEMDCGCNADAGNEPNLFPAVYWG